MSPDEATRVEVEIECPRHFGPEDGSSPLCPLCGQSASFVGGGEPGTITATLAPGSVAARKIAYAEAALHSWTIFTEGVSNRDADATEPLIAAFEREDAARTALRASMKEGERDG